MQTTGLLAGTAHRGLHELKGLVCHCQYISPIIRKSVAAMSLRVAGKRQLRQGTSMTTLGKMQQGVRLVSFTKLTGVNAVLCITGDSESTVNVADGVKNKLSGKGGCTGPKERGKCE